MWANILVILFLIGMTYWWGAAQGFFSALIHLLVTIVAAAMTIAIWEPLTFVLMDRMPLYAWGVALLGPFILLLIGLRILSDKLVPANVQFGQIVNMIGGGLCGLLAGILTAGLTIVGLGFLPLGTDIGGYQPLAVAPNGTVVQTHDSLWIPVDRLAVNAMEVLSRGSLSPMSHDNVSLALYQPQLDEQAGLFRLRYDKNASVVTVPKSVQVTGYYVIKRLPEGVDETVAQVFGPLLNQNRTLVIVDTKWELTAGTFDSDNTLRLPPTQIRLVTWFDQNRQARLNPPIAVSKPQFEADRVLNVFGSSEASAYGLSQREVFGWVFAIPDEDEPKSILLRHTRLMLPQSPNSNSESILTVLGQQPKLEPPEPETGAQVEAALPRRPVAPDTSPRATRTGTSHLQHRSGLKIGAAGVDIQITDALPEPISVNQAPQLQCEGKAVLSGTDEVGRARMLSPSVRVSKIFVPQHQACVRVEMNIDRAQSMYGLARQAGAGLGSIFLRDDRGQHWLPNAYVWARNTGKQRISISEASFSSARQLPIRDMKPGEKLYLYFRVQRNIEIHELVLGAKTKQGVEPPLVIPK